LVGRVSTAGSVQMSQPCGYILATLSVVITLYALWPNKK
jgi:hypothetical protein